MDAAENITSLGENGQLHRSKISSEQPTKAHLKCCAMIEKSCSAKYVKILMDGLLKLGCATSAEHKNIVCEPCTPKLVAAFDTEKNQIVICENDLFNQKFMDDVLTHELIHAYDVCRVKYDVNNLKHLACSSIRVANLTGDCFFWKENFLRFRFGWQYQQQVCVRNMAVKHMMASKKIDEDTARLAVESVFDACFNDHEPFIRIPP
ncbi:mitochondrial inner membrane protease ATP23 homolog isoform X4 [Hydra vulgaris]|uniref:Mitochondrial inner membrane protease ATP23 n=1 Tax=Hydra vulgaris TaxID=6087 RepID=A0ABM4CZA1_HYDVU